MRYGASVDILETLSGYDDTHGVKYSNIYIYIIGGSLYIIGTPRSSITRWDFP